MKSSKSLSSVPDEIVEMIDTSSKPKQLPKIYEEENEDEENDDQAEYLS